MAQAAYKVGESVAWHDGNKRKQGQIEKVYQPNMRGAIAYDIRFGRKVYFRDEDELTYADGTKPAVAVIASKPEFTLEEHLDKVRRLNVKIREAEAERDAAIKRTLEDLGITYREFLRAYSGAERIKG